MGAGGEARSQPRTELGAFLVVPSPRLRFLPFSLCQVALQDPELQGPELQGPEPQGRALQDPEFQGPEVQGPELQGQRHDWMAFKVPEEFSDVFKLPGWRLLEASGDFWRFLAREALFGMFKLVQ